MLLYITKHIQNESIYTPNKTYINAFKNKWKRTQINTPKAHKQHAHKPKQRKIITYTNKYNTCNKAYKGHQKNNICKTIKII